MASFDIVSELNLQEIDNAVNQAKKEVGGRYDLRGTACEIKWDKVELSLLADDEQRLAAVKDILQSKLHKRGIDLQSVQFDAPVAAGGMLLRQSAQLIQGIDKEVAKKIVKSIKDEKRLKVQAQIQDEQVRVTAKSIDALQECIAFCRAQKFGQPLQFVNMRS